MCGSALVGNQVPGLDLGVDDQLGPRSGRPHGAWDLAGEQWSFGALPWIGDRHGAEKALGVGVSGIPENLLEIGRATCRERV